MIKLLQWILGGTAAIALLYTIALNPQTTPFNWNPGAETPTEIPTYMIILGTFVGGYLIGLFHYWLGQIPKRLDAHKTRKSLEKENKKLEKELEKHQDDYDFSTPPTDILRD